MPHQKAPLLLTTLTTLTTLLTPLITYLLLTSYNANHAIYTVFHIPVPRELLFYTCFGIFVQMGIWVGWMGILFSEGIDDDVGMENGNEKGLGKGVGLGIIAGMGDARDFYGYGYGYGYGGQGYREVMDGRGVRSG